MGHGCYAGDVGPELVVVGRRRSAPRVWGRWTCGWWQGPPAKSGRTRIQLGLGHRVHVVHPSVVRLQLSMIASSLQVTCLMKNFLDLRHYNI